MFLPSTATKALSVNAAPVILLHHALRVQPIQALANHCPAGLQKLGIIERTPSPPPERIDAATLDLAKAQDVIRKLQVSAPMRYLCRID